MMQHQGMTINTMEAVNTLACTPIIAAEEDPVLNVEEIGEVSKVVRATVI